MFESLQMLQNPGIVLDTRVNPISRVASGFFYDKERHLYTIDAQPGRTKPPEGSHFLSFLILPNTPSSQERLVIINELFTAWLITTQFMLSEDDRTVGAMSLRVFDGREVLGVGAMFSLFLFDKPIQSEDEALEM